MTSLSEVYGGGARTVVDSRRRMLAISLFAVGFALVGTAVLLATTGVRSWVGYDIIEARRTAGIIAGFGLPIAIVGIFAALPASDEMRAAAAIGTSVAIFGVLLFAYAYPSRWMSAEPALALATIGIYGLGTLVTFWCLFVAVATFNTRNAPGGSTRVEITDEGKIRLVSAPPEPEPETDRGGVPGALGLGGIGVVGNDPDGEVPTQTNVARDTAEDVHAPDSWADAAEDVTPTATSDGGAVSNTPTENAGSGNPPNASSGNQPGTRSGTPIGTATGKPDPYCGNCAQFAYVEVSGELTPYCGFHDEFMDDLDACDEWVPNTDDA